MNKQELLATIQEIEDDPTSLDQKMYAVRLPSGRETFCFAGRVVKRADYQFDWLINNEVTEYCPKGEWAGYVMDNGTKRFIPEVAEEILDIPNWEAQKLFNPNNTIQDLKRIVSELVNS